MNLHDLNALKSWFLSQKRDLPWRDNPTPYAVWVSEVMLQQTQVSVVIPYFLRWMERFPTIYALAEAPLEVVLKHWEGLGYYSRARSLHEGALYVTNQHGGKLPNTKEELIKIKGLGEYTTSAILSFAFHQKNAPVDGNVMRVLSRYYLIEEDIAKHKVQKDIRLLAQKNLPDEEPWVISEALIELGATVCARKAKCFQCPLTLNCRAQKEGKTEFLPVKAKQKATTLLFRLVPILSFHDKLLVKKPTSKKIMADLYEFPYFEVEENLTNIEKQKVVLEEAVFKNMFLKAKWKEALPIVKHSFTRYRATLIPHVYQIYQTKDLNEIDGFSWLTIEQLKTLSFSSGHRQILDFFRG